MYTVSYKKFDLTPPLPAKKAEMKYKEYKDWFSGLELRLVRK